MVFTAVNVPVRDAKKTPCPGSAWTDNVAGLRMGGNVTCVYHAYEGGELVATGRLTLEGSLQVGDEVRLNGRTLVVRDVGFSVDAPLVTLEPK